MTPDLPVPVNQSGGVQVTEEDALPEIAWPRWEWVLGKRGIAIATIFGVLSYFTPLLTQEVPRWAWLAVGTILVLLWFLVPLVVYLKRASKAVRARYRQYPIACAYGKRTGRELEEARERINETLPYVSAFDLKSVIYEPIGPGTREMYIVVAKIEEVHLHVGDNLQVIDETDERPMGIFKVRQVREHDYYAIAVDVDPTWEGYVRQEGRREQYPPMNAVARLMRRSG